MNEWSREELPNEQGIGIVCLLHRKGDIMVCKYYKGGNVP